ncbi:o-succinylbenzoate synthase [Gordonia phthalatica]|uniref:o-succinylbenzoate synthase n=1 Tax=Gordonia phthalatica TaxID=1136941 RepID=A0A0N9MRR7_9ACTN|nr:o-succinylbenzoate synthase [Gordonia phthalatica]ALG85717.1 O-succinylbenzoate synthase [Gordonia phthalatica]
MVFSQPSGRNKQSLFGTTDDRKKPIPTFRLQPKGPPPPPKMPTVDDLLDTAKVVALPMHIRFRGVKVREALVFQGPAGWGEFAPFVEYDDAEAKMWLAAGIEAAYLGAPDPTRDSVRVNATVPAVPADQVAALIGRYPGVDTVKVKVAEPGQSLEDDVERVAAARDLVETVRIDANGAWSVAQAIEAITAIGDVEYVEQPCRTAEELAEVRKAVSVPIAADESIRRSGDPLRVAQLDAADIAVLKVAPLGGMRALLNLAHKLPMDVVVSSALDTAIGIAAGVNAAAALPNLHRACGLGTGELFSRDVAPSFRIEGGVVKPRRVEPGIDLPLASAERTQWWHDRLRRCHAQLVRR